MGLLVRILTAALIITCYLSIHGLVLAYSSGAGVQACETLMPLHFGTTPQTTFSPYQITARSNRYSPNNLVLVTLSQNPNPNAPTATTFRGILLQARADGSSSAVGSWLIQPDSEYSYRDGCPEPSSPLGSLTHNSGSDKSVLQPIEFDWIAPQNNVGSIRFFATVVQELNTFWVELTTSEVLTYFNSGVTFTDCPTTVNAFIPDGLTETTVIWTVPSAVDMSGNTVSLQSTHNPGDTFLIGTTPVTYSYVDGNGETFMCMFIVEVIVDTTPPTITSCPLQDVRVFINALDGEVPGAWTIPQAMDNSNSPVVVTENQAPGTTYPIGFYDVVYTFTDGFGNFATCEFTFVVAWQFDSQAPLIDGCPGPISVTSVGATVVTWVPPTATDDAGPVRFTTSHNPGDTFEVGVTDVTYTFEDTFPRTTSCDFSVTVVSGVDTTPPTITNCPSTIVRTTSLTSGFEMVTWNELVVEDPSQPVTRIEGPGGFGGFFSVGSTTTVIYAYQDSAGNIGRCTFDVTVTSSAVAVVCPATVAGTTTGQVGSTLVFDNEVSCTANGASIVCTPPSGSSFSVGSTPVTCICTDGDGNTDSCEFNAVVTNEGADNIPPVVENCPGDFFRTVTTTAPFAEVSWDPLIVTDNSGQTPTMVNGPINNFGFYEQGTNPVIYIFSDASGNEVRCEFTVEVTLVGGDANPQIVCPSVIVGNTPANQAGTALIFDNQVTCTDDNAVQSVLCTPASGSFFSIGTTSISCTCTDNAGNIDTCVFDGIVSVSGDNTPPVVQNCPTGGVSATAEPNLAGGFATWGPIIVTDDSGQTPSVASQFSSGDFFAIGMTSVLITYSDAAGNSVSCAFEVTITDVTPPTINNCPSPIVDVIPVGATTLQVTWTPPTATDNSQQTVSVTLDGGNVGDQFSAGQTVVRYTFNDASMNEAICDVVILLTLGINNPPVITCPQSFSVTSLTGNTGGLASWDPPTCVDQEDGNIILTNAACNPASQAFFQGTGINEVTCSCTDSQLITTQCTFFVTVEGQNNAPVITCPGDVSVVSLANNVGNFASWDIPTCVDIEDGNIVLDQSPCVPQSGGFFSNIGSSPVTCTCTDSGQLQSQCTFNVFVSDPSEIVSCQTDITETVLTGSGGSIVTYQEPVLDLGSGTFVLVSSPTLPSGAFFPIGQTVMQYIYSDGINQLDCTFTITVLEDALCNSDPCLNGAVCLDLSLTDFFCVCSGCFEGQLCQIEIDPCVGNQCGNGGVCIRDPTSCTQYWCQCSSCFTGQFCQIGLDACRSHQCQNGAMCVPDPVECDLYTCQCTGCFQGDFCQTAFDPCTAAPCQNNAICTNVADSCSAYSCQCIGCFTGFNCEEAIPSPCAVNPCLNSGICLPVVNSCTAQTCLCPPSFGGAFCENAIVSQDNPCNNNPCLNYGTCASYGSEYKCYCRPGFSGINCQFSTAVVSGISSCDNMPCLNNGVCYNSYVTTSSSVVYIAQYTCVCPVGFTGQNCALLTLNNPGQDACATNAAGVCQNGGTCRNSYCSFDQTLDYFCECPIGFTGQFCDIPFDDPCQPNPCANTAQCTSFNTYFVCTCVGGFTGRTCEVPPEDDTSPIVSGCPTQPIVVVAEPGETFAVVSWTVPTAVDDSGDPVVVASVNSAPGARYNVNTLQTVIYMFADSNGNIEVCMFDIQVLPASTDTEDPVLTFCPGNIIEEVAVGSQTGTVTWTEPTATDNSGTVIPSSDFSSPLVLNVGDSQTVTYRLSDPSGNFVECIFMVSVVEQFAIACPPDQTLIAGAGNTAVAAWPDPVTTDSNLPVSINCSPQEGSLLQIGNVLVNCLATDTIRSDSCTFNVVVVSSDNDGPVLTCPDDIVREISTAEETATIDWNEPTAFDASPPVTLMANLDPPLLVALGSSTSIMYTGTDALGNMGSCSFTITVIGDTAGPELICPPSQNLFIQSSGDELVVTWDAATVVDNVDNNIIPNPTILPGTRFSEGPKEITYIALDSSGNFGTCSFTVTVSVDSDLPVISGCPSDQTVTDPSGSAAVSWVEPTVTDATSMVTLTSTSQPGDTFSGPSTVTYTAVDEAGNTASCTFSVTVNTEQGRRKRELLSIEVEEDINAERANKMFLPAVASLLVALSLSVFAVIFIRRYRTNYIRTDEVVNIQ